jgi:diguanylate cyclase (GGDEF)-like protein
VNRDQRLLAIVQAQTDIAIARLDAHAAIALVVQRAHDLTGAEATDLELIEGDTLLCAHAVGAAAPRIGSRTAVSDSPFAQAIGRDTLVRGGDGSTMWVPLARDGAAAGVLAVSAGQGRGFDDDDAETLKLLAAILTAHLPGDQPSWGRRAYDERLAHECARRAREGGPLTVVLLKVDGLARINAEHGTPVGDGVLRTADAVLRRWTRSIDGVYRIAAEGFALVLPSATSGAADVLIERIAHQLADAHPLRPTAHFGAAEAAGDDPAELHGAAAAQLDRATQLRTAA